MERVEVTDEWLYKYMPVVDAAIIQELESQSDKDYEFSRRFQRQMKNLISQEAHPWIGIVKNLMKRVAVFLIGVIGATLIFTMSVEAYRKKFFETIKTFFSDSVFYNYSMTDQIDKFSCYIPTYIPNGYKEIEKNSSDVSLGIVYEDQEGKLITWNQTLVNEATTVLLDTEYDRLEKIEVEDGRIDIALYDSGYVCAYYEYDHYIFILTADYLSIEEVIRMLESIVSIEPFERQDSTDNETVQNDTEKDIYNEDIGDGEFLEAICYNGVCYYGLAMTEIIEEGEEPEGFTYLGKISSVKEGYQSPTEELETTVFEVGDDVYYYVDEEGSHNFCIPVGGDKYKGIYLATTQKPDYYDELRK